MSKHFLIAALVLFAGTSRLNAQVTTARAEAPVISRMCLWNATKDTWSALGLKKNQVRSLEEIKRRYPAVVDGQWIMDDKAPERRTTARAGAQPVAGPTGPEPDKPGDLQCELRAVLAPEQMRAWAAYCIDQITQ